MAAIADFARLFEGQQVVQENIQAGQAAENIAKSMVQMARQFINRKATQSKDDEDRAVFHAALVTLTSKVSAVFGTASSDELALIQQVITGAMPSQSQAP